MIKKTFATLMILMFCACSSTYSRNYEAIMYSEQPVTTGTIAAVVATDRDYYYEKYLTDELIKKMETRGWKRAPLKQAEYALSVSVGHETPLQAAATKRNKDASVAVGHENDINVISEDTGKIITGNFIDLDIYDQKTKTPKISMQIRSSDTRTLDMMNDALPILDKELQAKNAFLYHVWTCEFDEINNKSNCYMEPVNPQIPTSGREEKTLKTHKAKIIKHPYL